MSEKSITKKEAAKDLALKFSGYYKNKVKPHDPELTHVGPGTAMGEYMRKFWHPVCLSQELTDVPKAIRILGEDLVAFRDGAGRVGVLHRKCSHRGASLEFGIVCENGIRCCYHGWQYDIDGTILELPCEPEDSPLKGRISQGAYPAFERHGMVFAYMGDPATQPEFPEYDSFHYPADQKMYSYALNYECNWLQACENILDHYHTCTLHNNMVAAGTSESLAKRLTLDGFGGFPVVHWEESHDGNGILFAAGRRMDPEKVWVRITHAILPNFMQIGSPTAQASKERHSTVGHSRWTVPVDDENCRIFGWRHFHEVVDPEGVGNPDEIGIEKFDFLGGQVAGRPYEEQQRAPGDYEALVSQGKVAVHAMEHPGRSDVGVYMYRQLLRKGVRGELPENKIYVEMDNKGDTRHIYTQDSILRIPMRNDKDDRKLLDEVNHKIVTIMREGDSLSSKERESHIRERLNELDDDGALTPRQAVG